MSIIRNARSAVFVYETYEKGDVRRIYLGQGFWLDRWGAVFHNKGFTEVVISFLRDGQMYRLER